MYRRTFDGLTARSSSPLPKGVDFAFAARWSRQDDIVPSRHLHHDQLAAGLHLGSRAYAVSEPEQRNRLQGRKEIRYYPQFTVVFVER